MMKRGSSFIQNMDNKRREIVDHLEYISHDIVRSFMHFFGSDGRLRSWLSKRRSALNYSEDHCLTSSSESVGCSSSGSSTSEPGRRQKFSGKQNSQGSRISRKRNASMVMLDELKHNPDNSLPSTNFVEEEDFVVSEPEMPSYDRPIQTRRSLNSYRSSMTTRKMRKLST
ncbi:Choline-phosphate cytidylyltransferase [Fasciola hepatica]|uniref:Choline-phosphate cytidylyltransferase n=1 Tax=Fasciola hepatica TaxID=6192 RepID=A0A4E0RB27_FASHE|nr:Choline-phosphate cytidylyltransferase [Fasciola hepatica]